MACQVDCLAKYGCSTPATIEPSYGAVYAPWVSVNLGNMITVGNKSFPSDKNTAVIKSLDYGGSDGMGIVIEIIDEAGTSFERYFKKINKDLCSATDDYHMTIDFGWIARSCDGIVTKTGLPEGPLTFLPSEVESAYEGGVIKYTFKGTDFLRQIGENRVAKPIGTEGSKVRLRQAIEQMLSRNCPPVNSVKFFRRNGVNLIPWDFRNSDGGPDGPMGVWPADQQNALSAIRKWGNSVTTDRRKGFTPVWNCGSATPELWLIEDARDYCDEAPGADCVGTYIVNGGNCSPVISFSPQAKWPFTAGLGSGGNMGGSTSARTQEAKPLKGRLCDLSAKAGVGGIASQFPPPQNAINWRSPDSMAAKEQEALAAQELAAQYKELVNPMEAELKIHGDTNFVHPIRWIGRTVSIIVINPFHVFNGGSNCEWIAGPTCNSVYSDKTWTILGVNHQISDGSFVTTLKLFLASPTKTNPPK